MFLRLWTDSGLEIFHFWAVPPDIEALESNVACALDLQRFCSGYTKLLGNSALSTSWSWGIEVGGPPPSPSALYPWPVSAQLLLIALWPLVQCCKKLDSETQGLCTLSTYEVHTPIDSWVLCYAYHHQNPLYYKEWDVRLHCIHLAQVKGPVAGSCERRNEPSKYNLCPWSSETIRKN
jgi:hypothetical protein